MASPQKTSKKKKKKKSSQETPTAPQATDSIGQRRKKKQKDLISLGISSFSSEDSSGEAAEEQPPNNSTDAVDASDRAAPDDQCGNCGRENGDISHDAERVINGDSGVEKSVSCSEEDKNKEVKLEAKQKLKGKKAKDARKRAKEANSSAGPESKVSPRSVGSLYIFLYGMGLMFLY